METPARILLIRPSALGDVCRSVPVLASLRGAFPSARIDWLVREGFADAVSAHPALSGVVEFPRGRVGLARLWRQGARRALHDFLGRLRSGGYDAVFDCQGLWRSGCFAWVTRAPRRVGFADARELGWLGLTQRVRVDSRQHSVDRMLSLLEGAGVPAVRDIRLYVPGADARWYADLALPGRPVVLAPTSAWAGKRWPAERFAALARSLLDDGATPCVVVVGGPGEADQCGPLVELAARNPRVVNLVGRTSVGQLMAVIQGSSLVVANDSAAVHMAVGLGRPLVALYGPTRVDLVGPYGRPQDVVQASAPRGGNRHKDATAGLAAMRAISLESVASACTLRLGARAQEAWS